MTDVVVISGGCGTGKTETLRAMHDALDGLVTDVAVLETDLYYTMMDPSWSVPWPEAGRYFDLALDNICRTTIGFIEAEFDLVAIGSNGLCDQEIVLSFARRLDPDRRAQFHHITLDPGVSVVQERIARRKADRAHAVDDEKTPEWLESQLMWFRQRYGPWTYVLDNSDLTPRQTAQAVFRAVRDGAGLQN